MKEAAIQKCITSIKKAKRICVFSGAGMSKDSGIDTFRGNGGGFWSGIFGSIALAYGGTPFGWNLTPGYVWSYFISNFYEPIAKASPHAGYYALTRIEQYKRSMHGQFFTVTMNVDGFHQAAGADPSSVFEVHGTVRRFRCIKCSATIAISDPLQDRNNPPKCVSCGGYPRPDVTLFTESLPPDQWSGASNAVSSLSDGDVMIIVGTSSVVYPAASLPSYAREMGATLIEINPDESTPLSEIVHVHLRGTAAVILPQIAEAVVLNSTRIE